MWNAADGRDGGGLAVVAGVVVRADGTCDRGRGCRTGKRDRGSHGAGFLWTDAGDKAVGRAATAADAGNSRPGFGRAGEHRRG